MCIVRKAKKRNPFVKIDKTPLQDRGLSWKARGILAFLLAKPDNWTVSMSNLANESDADGQESVKTGIKELEEAGYILRIKSPQDDKGQFSGIKTIVFETIEDAREWKEENPQHIKPATGKPHGRENPRPENPPQIINKDLLINELTNPPYPPVQVDEEGEEEKSDNAIAFQPFQSPTAHLPILVEPELKLAATPTNPCCDLTMAADENDSQNQVLEEKEEASHEQDSLDLDFNCQHPVDGDGVLFSRNGGVESDVCCFGIPSRVTGRNVPVGVERRRGVEDDQHRNSVSVLPDAHSSDIWDGTNSDKLSGNGLERLPDGDRILGGRIGILVDRDVSKPGVLNSELVSDRDSDRVMCEYSVEVVNSCIRTQQELTEANSIMEKPQDSTAHLFRRKDQLHRWETGKTSYREKFDQEFVGWLYRKRQRSWDEASFANAYREISNVTKSDPDKMEVEYDEYLEWKVKQNQSQSTVLPKTDSSLSGTPNWRNFSQLEHQETAQKLVDIGSEQNFFDFEGWHKEWFDQELLNSTVLRRQTIELVKEKYGSDAPDKFTSLLRGKTPPQQYRGRRGYLGRHNA